MAYLLRRLRVSRPSLTKRLLRSVRALCGRVAIKPSSYTHAYEGAAHERVSARLRRPVKFVPSSTPLYDHNRMIAALARGRPIRPVRPVGGSLHVKAFPGIGYDSRVAGTFLEAANARRYRELWHASGRGERPTVLSDEERGPLEADRWLMAICARGRPHKALYLAPRGQLRNFVYPGDWTCAISDFELQHVLKQPPEAVAIVDAVKRAAPPSLADLLAGEDWGVMEF